MKLISCYVENFGTLHQFAYEFQDGINTIKERNGWGKSTFAAFIRAMFYGMEATRTRSNLDDAERKKYKPWQGGSFGGFLVFETRGKRYKLERFFADKEQGDTFTLYDIATGLESHEYSKKIGEELFMLDREAYSRSTYIPQNAISIKTNDSLHAKLSNLIDNENDINNYESAMNLLEKGRKEYSKTGGRGKLDLIRNQIITLEQELVRCQSKETEAVAWSDKLTLIVSSKKEQEVKLQSLKSQIIAAGRYEGIQTKLQQYEDICKEHGQLQEELVPLEQFFADKLPSEEEIKGFESEHARLLQLSGELNSLELTIEELADRERLIEEFTKGIPNEEELDVCDKQIQIAQSNDRILAAGELTLKEQTLLSDFDEFFASGIPDVAEIDRYIKKANELNEIRSRIETEKGKLSLLEHASPVAATSSHKIKTGLLLRIAAALLAATGIIVISMETIVGIGCLLSGIAVFLVSVSVDRKQKQKRKEKEKQEDAWNQSNQGMKELVNSLLEEKQFIEEELTHFIKRFHGVDQHMNYYIALSNINAKANQYRDIIAKHNNQSFLDLKKEQARLINEIDAFLKEYCENIPVPLIQKQLLLRRIGEDTAILKTLDIRRKNYEEARGTYQKRQKHLLEEFEVYFVNGIDDLGDNLNMLKDRYRDYIRLRRNVEELGLKKTQFEAENNTKVLMEFEKPEHSLTQLQEHENQQNDVLTKILSELNHAEEQIRKLSFDADKVSDLQTEIEQLAISLSLGEKRLSVIEKTMHCLEKSKDSFSMHYMNQMNQGFKQYVSLLDHGGIGNVEMDVQLNVSVAAYGEQKSLQYYSTGYKDLIGICIRFALVDALFEAEKPFIILDDPFANLDDEKLEHALNVLKQIAGKYQLIYLVCSESRGL